MVSLLPMIKELAAITALMGLAACAVVEAEKPVPVTVTTSAVVVAPRPVEYTCAQQARLAAEMSILPEEAYPMVNRMFVDYKSVRDQLRAIHKIDPKCKD